MRTGQFTSNIVKLSLALLGALAISGSTSAMADGDAVAGQKMFKKGRACHVLVPGKKKVGPNLEMALRGRAEQRAAT